MRFNTLQLYHYRNLQDRKVEVGARQIYLVGENGQGKTNFLEAVYLLCYGKSFRTNSDRELIKHEHKDMSIHAAFDNEETVFLKIIDKKKTIEVDGKKIKDRKDLIEKAPCIVFSHEDIDFVKGPPEKRRWFFNQTMSLHTPMFINLLRNYNKVIKMRNAVLREAGGSILDIYDQQLAAIGMEIQSRRKTVISSFNQTFRDVYRRISGMDSDLNVVYVPSWNKAVTVEDAIKRLEKKKSEDFAMKNTTTGPHRDKIFFILHDRNFARIASTGQQRLVSLVLRVAQASFYYEMTKRKPLLLIDDVLLELDSTRRMNFLDNLPIYEQAFFTFLPDEPYTRYKTSSTLVYNVQDGDFTGVG
jgi:DNA replication and repair protein RecF